MAYFIRTLRLGDGTTTGTLVESRTMPASDRDNVFHYAVSADRAHRWVRNGGIHETGLWLDGTRIRKAQPCRGDC